MERTFSVAARRISTYWIDYGTETVLTSRPRHTVTPISWRWKVQRRCAGNSFRMVRRWEAVPLSLYRGQLAPPADRGNAATPWRPLTTPTGQRTRAWRSVSKRHYARMNFIVTADILLFSRMFIVTRWLLNYWRMTLEQTRERRW